MTVLERGHDRAGTAGITAAGRRRAARWICLGPAAVVTAAGLGLPLTLMLLFSFWRYAPTVITDRTWTLANYGRLLSDFFYLGVILQTLQLGLIVTVLALILGYPLAYFLARTTSGFKRALTYLVFVPMMVGVVDRTYGWIVILGHQGLVNSLLLSAGLIREPLRLLYTRDAVILGLLEILLPFMVLPLLAAIEKINRHVEEAARVLGATPAQTFWRVTVPLSRPGILSGSLLVFSLTITAYALPALLGGAKVKMISALAYDAMLVGYNWPFGSAIGILMLAGSGAAIYYYLRLGGGPWEVRG